MMKREELDQLLKPVAAGLFGKQELRRYERPRYTIRPLAGMLRDLAAIEPVDWYRYAFSREPLNGRFDDRKRREWMVKCLDCGCAYAQRMADEYQTRDPQAMAAAMGMEVSYPEFPEKTDRVLFAEYRKPNRISIYIDAVKKTGQLLAAPDVGEILTGTLDIGRLLLAHELFHSIEERFQDVIFTKTEKVRLWSLGVFHNDSTVIAFSEIAAMGFAGELMGISYSPYLMDVFLVYGYSPEEASGLYEEMMMLADQKLQLMPCVE